MMNESQRKIQIIRDNVNELTDKFGEIMMAQGMDDDKALMAMTLWLVDIGGDPKAVSAHLAFAIRRLWFKRAQPVRTTPN